METEIIDTLKSLENQAKAFLDACSRVENLLEKKTERGEVKSQAPPGYKWLPKGNMILLQIAPEKSFKIFRRLAFKHITKNQGNSYQQKEINRNGNKYRKIHCIRTHII